MIDFKQHELKADESDCFEIRALKNGYCTIVKVFIYI